MNTPTPNTDSHHHHHTERHFMNSQFIRDAVLGAADGLTVPFALAAGLAGVLDSQNIIVAAGFAEIAAGTIAMGLGGYLAEKSQIDYYDAEYAREVREVDKVPHIERAEVKDELEQLGLEGTTLNDATDAICADKDRWVDFMMRFELGLEEPDPHQAKISSATIGGAYFIGGLIPLAPYILLDSILPALIWSSALTLITLFSFGAAKGKFMGINAFKSGFETALVGGLAALTAYVIASAIV